jgi:heme-degrading monooxygenase HmoA
VVLANTRKRAELGPEYPETAARMRAIVTAMPGYLGSRTYTAADGEQITVWRFASAEALHAWRNHPEPAAVQQYGRDAVYDSYWVQVCEIVRAYEFDRVRGRRDLTHAELVAGW